MRNLSRSSKLLGYAVANPTYELKFNRTSKVLMHPFMTVNYLKEEARLGKRKDFDALFRKVPDVEPA